MRLASNHPIRLEVFAPSPVGVALLGAVAVGVAAGTIAVGHALAPAVQRFADAPGRVVDPYAPPGAAEFGARFVAVSNAYAASHGARARLSQPHCVQGDRGHYMCAYTVTRGARRECHLMQAEWTPGKLSSFRVTLSGRSGKCGSVRQAVRSLS
jgi:hypothetical protein